MGRWLTGRLFFLSFSFLPSCLGYWQEKRAIEAVLLAVGTDWRFRSLEDIASGEYLLDSL